jgi:hypothetical protein
LTVRSCGGEEVSEFEVLDVRYETYSCIPSGISSW